MPVPHCLQPGWLAPLVKESFFTPARNVLLAKCSEEQDLTLPDTCVQTTDLEAVVLRHGCRLGAEKIVKIVRQNSADLEAM